ncbi:hypothetical protein LIER_40391 [Lithospermum erythrorhizon]|uniref:Uncharacterized protein n=1 Tax=Lithospermum erythrorhizon TaxID=34254 RepID=A0AAV3QTX9_LITER
MLGGWTAAKLDLKLEFDRIGGLQEIIQGEDVVACITNFCIEDESSIGIANINMRHMKNVITRKAIIALVKACVCVLCGGQATEHIARK